MNDNTKNPFTLFDNLLQNSQLQTMKLLLPFLPAANQKMMVLLIKFLELKYTMDFFRKGNALNICSASDEDASPIDKIAAMKDYLPKKEQETIDNIINMMSAMELFQSMSDDGSSPFPFPMDFFSKDDSDDDCETPEPDTAHACETPSDIKEEEPSLEETPTPLKKSSGPFEEPSCQPAETPCQQEKTEHNTISINSNIDF